MATIQAGETWTLALGDKMRDVTVIAETGSPAWWCCADLETGIEFIASARWFAARISFAGAEVDLSQPGGVRA